MQPFWRTDTGSAEAGMPGLVPAGWGRDVRSSESSDGVTVDVGPKVAMALGALGILTLTGYAVYRASR